MVATRLVQQLDTFLLGPGRKSRRIRCLVNKRTNVNFGNDLWTGRRGTCLVYYIDERLCVGHREAMNHSIHVLVRNDRLDQEREFMQRKCAFNQTFMGYGVQLRENQGVVSSLRIGIEGGA